MDFVTATYRLRCSQAEAPAFAKQIALEQTVEVPESLLNSPRIRDDFVGRVRSISSSPTEEHVHHAVIDYPAELAGPHAGQLWNLLYGNISLKRHVRLVDVEIPATLRQQFPGPKYGITGLRKWLGVFSRPLLATALKPRGSTSEQFAELAFQFALGGGDFVKDDHNLVEASFSDFQRRTDACQSAVERATQETGRLCVYAPNLSPPIHELSRYVDFLTQRGIHAALIAPFLLGIDTVRHLAATTPLFLMAHPTFTGCYFHDPEHGIEPGLLLGQWFRNLGCDATIFPNHGGRFSFSPEECQSIVTSARTTENLRVGCWPAPAGGMSFDRLTEMAEDYGTDTIFLIGGALLGDSDSVRDSTQRFAQHIEQQFPQHQCATPQPPFTHSARTTVSANSASPVSSAAENQPEFVSACELPAAGENCHPQVSAALLNRLAHQAGFHWDGRAAVAYKTNGLLPFAGVSRTELVGQFGEQTAFDVRYFEIAPGGYSSLEKHQHTHVIIGTQGQGTLLLGDRQLPISPWDIAYVEPMQVHQLRNSGTEPFGFLCIVDHVRDRPQAP